MLERWSLRAAIEIELDGLGVERRAVVEHDVLAQVQHQRLRIGETPASARPGRAFSVSYSHSISVSKMV